MKRILLTTILPLILLATGLSGQNWLRNLTPVKDGRPYWEVFSQNYYTRSTATNVWYPNSEVGLTYRGKSYRLGARWRLRQSQNFQFAPRQLIIVVDDNDIEFTDDTQFKSRPDYYEVDIPLNLTFAVQRGKWEIITSLAALWQHTRIEEPRLGAVSDSLFFLNWTPVDHRSTRLVSSLAGLYRLHNLELLLGFLSFPGVRFGDRDFRYEFRPQLTPLWGVAWQLPHTRMSGLTDSRTWSLEFRQTLPATWTLREGAQAGVTVQSGFSGVQFRALQAELRVPLTSAISAEVDYQGVWSDRREFTRQGFREWQETHSFSGFVPLNQRLPHQSFSLGLRWRIAPAVPVWPVQLVKIRWLQKHIYPAKREFYAHNPLAIVDIYNRGERAVNLQLVLETSNDAAGYRSEELRLNPQEMRSVPLYLYLREPPPGEQGSAEQMVLSAVIEGRSRILSAQPVQLHGRHAWDGNTWSLKYFVAPDDPTIKSRAKQLYLQGSRSDASNTPGAQFERLQQFIEGFGRHLRYLPDPTTTLTVDQVQYPVETLTRGSGDCEDLTVCLASGLMAVGISAAVVDVRPSLSPSLTVPTAQPGSLGHVFLLADTGIKARYRQEIGLNEFQAIVRPNSLGEHTIWIPLETAVLSRGFEAAFTEGARRYYREVIEKEGVVNGSVHILELN